MPPTSPKEPNMTSIVSAYATPKKTFPKSFKD